MKRESATALLSLIIILFAGFRIAVAFSQPTLTFDGYKNLNHLEHIVETGKPLIEDPLSYGGRTHTYNPVYYYLMAPFALISNPTITLKFIPNIIFSIIIVMTYLISYDITKNRTASILASLLAAMTPITLSYSINDGSPLTMIAPLIMIMAYAAMYLKERMTLLIISGVLTAMISPLSFTAVLGLIIYIIITSAENISTGSEYKEATIFLMLFSIWVMLITYKKALVNTGLGAIWAYLPKTLLKAYFSEFTMPTAATAIGVIPLLLGGYAAYRALFYERIKKTLLISGFAASATLILILRVAPLREGMLLLALMLCSLSGEGIRRFMIWLSKTRISWSKTIIISAVIIFVILSSLLPAVTEAASRSADTPTPEQIRGYEWLSKTERGMVLAPVKEGFAIEHYAKQRTYYDKDFFMIPDIDKKYEDARTIYLSRFSITALTLANKYNIKYIIVDDISRNEFGKEDLLYESQCFKEAYNDGIKIYEVTCDVRTE